MSGETWTMSGISTWHLRRPCGHHAATIYQGGTWSTWDRDGVGGENAEDKEIDEAKRQVVLALARQGWHGPDCEPSPKMVDCPTCDGEGEVTAEPTPATPAAPGGEVELLERAAKLLDICNHGETVGRLSPTRALREDVETWLRDYRRPREGK